jgi:hypothetical protein
MSRISTHTASIPAVGNNDVSHKASLFTVFTVGYHWDHSDLTQPQNISPTNTLPPPPDIPDSISLVSGSGVGPHPPHLSGSHEPNNLDTVTTINLAALPPIETPINERQMGPLHEEDEDDDVNPHEPLPYFDTEGTSCDEPNWTIPHPDQYLPLHRVEDVSDCSESQHQMCSCPQLEAQNQKKSSSKEKPMALRNRYRQNNSLGKKGASSSSSNTSGISSGSHKVSDISEDEEISENASLLGGSPGSLPQIQSANGNGGHNPSTSFSGGGGSLSSLNSGGKSKIPRPQNSQPNSSSVTSLNSSGGSGSLGPSSKKSHSKTTHVTQV